MKVTETGSRLLQFQIVQHHLVVDAEYLVFPHRPAGVDAAASEDFQIPADGRLLVAVGVFELLAATNHAEVNARHRFQRLDASAFDHRHAARGIVIHRLLRRGHPAKHR